MATHADAEKYIAEMGATVRPIAQSAHEVMIDLGCASYVKTIYIGYEISGEMVASLYGHARFAEVALALEEGATGPLLDDASHLKWRTLPVAAALRSVADLPEFKMHAEAACSRVRERAHDVNRDNTFFARRHGRRRLTD